MEGSYVADPRNTPCEMTRDASIVVSQGRRSRDPSLPRPIGLPLIVGLVASTRCVATNASTVVRSGCQPIFTVLSEDGLPMTPSTHNEPVRDVPASRTDRAPR